MNDKSLWENYASQNDRPCTHGTALGNVVGMGLDFLLAAQMAERNVHKHSKTIHDAPQKTGLQPDRSVEEEVECNLTPEIMINCFCCIYVLSTTENNKEEKSKGGIQQLLEYP